MEVACDGGDREDSGDAGLMTNVDARRTDLPGSTTSPSQKASLDDNSVGIRRYL